MSRLANHFAQLRAQHKRALIPYITAGDPEPKLTVPLMHALVAAGADILELGVPFSDPMADGPVIQAACERALVHHVTLDQVLDWVAEFRQQNTTTPVVLMGYLNPIESMGYESFVQRAQQVSIDGVLVVDLPPEEAEGWLPVMQAAELDPIFLLSPTTDAQRMQTICEHASGFVYYVSLKGVTGSHQLNVNDVAEKVEQIRGLTELPVGVGFGIRDAQTAAQVAAVSDAVVVGSALVSLIAQHASDHEMMIKQVVKLVQSMRSAIDQVA